MRAPRGHGELRKFMPWRLQRVDLTTLKVVLGRMTDDELHAIWLYQAGPPRAFGNR